MLNRNRVFAFKRGRKIFRFSYAHSLVSRIVRFRAMRIVINFSGVMRIVYHTLILTIVKVEFVKVARGDCYLSIVNVPVCYALAALPVRLHNKIQTPPRAG